MGPEELGRQLRRARQHRGLSLRDVHAITAIPLPCLAALEEGDLGQLPSPVYARGYVRSYAEAVRLDGDRLALELSSVSTTATRPNGSPKKAASKTAKKVVPAPQPSSLAPLRQKAPWAPKQKRFHKPKAPRILRPNAGRMMKKSSRRPKKGPGRFSKVAPVLERVAIVILLVVLGVGIWALVLQRGPSKSDRASTGVRTSGVTSQTPDSPPPTTVTPTPATVPAPPFATVPAADNGSQATYTVGREHFTVAVLATDAPLWIQVKAAPRGPVVFMGTLQKGEARPFDAPGVLLVRVGNLGHTAVSVDGTPLTLPAKPSSPYNLLLQK